MGPVGCDEPVVRRVVQADWPALRALRLEALADCPIAYLETLAAAELLADSAWQARAARGARGGDSCQVLALQDGRPVGTCVTFLLDGAPWLAAVYVTPRARGRGLLARLLAPCAEWARAHGGSRLTLEVHEDNGRARQAYARLGFVATGATTPYPLPPGGLEQEMVLELG